MVATIRFGTPAVCFQIKKSGRWWIGRILGTTMKAKERTREELIAELSSAAEFYMMD